VTQHWFSLAVGLKFQRTQREREKRKVVDTTFLTLIVVASLLPVFQLPSRHLSFFLLDNMASIIHVVYEYTVYC